MSLLSSYLVKKNFIGLKDFRNFDVLLLLTNSFWRKFGFNSAQTCLWCKTMAIMVDDRNTTLRCLIQGWVGGGGGLLIFRIFSDPPRTLLRTPA